MLTPEAGEDATAYHGNIDDLMVDLRSILTRHHPKENPKYVDEGRVKGYMIKTWYLFDGVTRYQYTFIPVKGITDKGGEVDAYALEVFVSNAASATRRRADAAYKVIKKGLDSKYSLVRVKSTP
jgi:hypothetical protein